MDPERCSGLVYGVPTERGARGVQPVGLCVVVPDQEEPDHRGYRLFRVYWGVFVRNTGECAAAIWQSGLIHCTIFENHSRFAGVLHMPPFHPLGDRRMKRDVIAVVLIGGVVALGMRHRRSDPPSQVTRPIEAHSVDSDEQVSLTAQNDHSGVARIPLRSAESSVDGESNPSVAVRDVSHAHLPRATDSAAGVRWLSAAEADRFQFGQLRSKAEFFSTSESRRPRIIKSREDAITHLNTSLSMALSPSVAFEDEAFFYFSGGNTAYAVRDFSQGIAINRATGDLLTW